MTYWNRENRVPSTLSEFSELLVLCDGESDTRLFKQLKKHHPLLSHIPDGAVETYGQARNMQGFSALEAAVRPLHQDDRPDFIICRGDKPLLVIELTQHAYTGDNGLQRFARFAAAAEAGVPFMYFGPRARVRDDELDGLNVASPRSLTSDLFEGMRALATVLGTPQIFVEWLTDSNGLPAALPTSFEAADVQHLYGELLEGAATLLEAQLQGVRAPDLLKQSKIKSMQEATNKLAETKNTRTSEVRLEIPGNEVKELVFAPSMIEGYFVDNGYFSKGKPDKLLALYAIRQAKISAVQLPDGSILTGQAAIAVLEMLFDRVDKLSNSALLYYTGYKWRSDPHAGVLVNLDYRICRQPDEPTPAARKKPLIVVYPRISMNKHSDTWKSLKSISATTSGSVESLFKSRYPSDWQAKMSCLKTSNPYSLWANSTKQARIFRRYADIIVLNDGIILGDSLAGEFESK